VDDPSVPINLGIFPDPHSKTLDINFLEHSEVIITALQSTKVAIPTYKVRIL
jgi:hypothetical protein